MEHELFERLLGYILSMEFGWYASAMSIEERSHQLARYRESLTEMGIGETNAEDAQREDWTDDFYAWCQAKAKLEEWGLPRGDWELEVVKWGIKYIERKHIDHIAFLVNSLDGKVPKEGYPDIGHATAHLVAVCRAQGKGEADDEIDSLKAKVRILVEELDAIRKSSDSRSNVSSEEHEKRFLRDSNDPL